LLKRINLNTKLGLIEGTDETIGPYQGLHIHTDKMILTPKLISGNKCTTY